MNVASTGNSIYNAIKDTPSACAKVRSELAELSLAIVTDPNASARVTSATVNGQTFTAQSTMTNEQRRQVLSWVVKCLDAGAPISTTQIPTF